MKTVQIPLQEDNFCAVVEFDTHVWQLNLCWFGSVDGVGLLLLENHLNSLRLLFFVQPLS